jgi:hypothetical protein
MHILPLFDLTISGALSVGMLVVRSMGIMTEDENKTALWCAIYFAFNAVVLMGAI